MRRFSEVLTLLLLLTCSEITYGSLWIGETTTTGEVSPGPGYQLAVQPYSRQVLDFDQYNDGEVLSRRDLGGLFLVSLPSYTVITAQYGLADNAIPSSAPAAALISRDDSSATTLNLSLFDPVQSVGFVLMGLESGGTVRVYDEEQILRESCQIPGGIPGIRRHVGIVWTERQIGKLSIEPFEPESYAIDDIELGRHAPEPSTLALFCMMSIMLKRRK